MTTLEPARKKIVSDFKSIVAHMHLKDYSGWEHFGGYTPLGEGKVDLKSILETMEAANPNAPLTRSGRRAGGSLRRPGRALVRSRARPIPH